MRTISKIAPVLDPKTGEDVAHKIEEMDIGWGCLSEGLPIPKFKRARYVAPDPLWSHDHCELCSDDFFEADDDGKGTLGWIMDDPGDDVPMQQDTGRTRDGKSSISSPSNTRNWLCDECHRVIMLWVTGALEVKIVEQREIPGSPIADRM